MIHPYLDIGIISVSTVAGILLDLYRGRSLLKQPTATPWVILAAFVLEPVLLGTGIGILVVWRPAGITYVLMLITLFVLLYGAGWVGDIARDRLQRN
jgi:hypothetical protein